MDTDALKRMNELIEAWDDFQKIADRHEAEMMAYRYQASLYFDQLNKEFPNWRDEQ